MILGCRRLQKPSEQGCCGSDVLACPGEVWEGFVVLDDPPVHVMGHGTCTPVGIKGVARVTVEAETLMHRGRGAWPAASLCLVD